MTQEDAIVKQKVSCIESKIKKINGDILKIEKCMKTGKQVGLNDYDLKPWEDKRRELMTEHLHLQGKLQDIHNTCEHDFQIVGTWESMFGTENIYQCSKCGYQKSGE